MAVLKCPRGETQTSLIRPQARSGASPDITTGSYRWSRCAQIHHTLFSTDFMRFVTVAAPKVGVRRVSEGGEILLQPPLWCSTPFCGGGGGGGSFLGLEMEGWKMHSLALSKAMDLFFMDWQYTVCIVSIVCRWRSIAAPTYIYTI